MVQGMSIKTLNLMKHDYIGDLMNIPIDETGIKYLMT